MWDLRNEAFIPFRRNSGAIEWGRPALLTDQIDSNPIVAVAAPRADFNGALQEFLVGLLSIAFAIEDHMAWRALWIAPPTRPVLQERFDALPAAFYLDGNGPRFMQDLSVTDFTDAEPIPIEQMLIDAPGDQTAKLNKDLFVKRARVERLGRPAAAMALLTLQTYAPSGGQGHRTSLRGGGPLTTLIDPRTGSDDPESTVEPLWKKLWANVATRAEWANSPGKKSHAPNDVFPWMGPTRTSNGAGGATTPEDAHPAQAYFGLPRRIRLDFSGPGRCDLTGMHDEETVTVFRMKNYGVQYSGWKHPLSPYYRTKETEPWLPVHGQPGGLSWRDWIDLTMISPHGATREPAQAVSRFIQERAPEVHMSEVRLHAFGYDMDNMKARGWIESQRPVFVVDDPTRSRVLVDTARRLTEGTDIAARELLSAGKNALFNRPEDARGDFSQYRSQVWDGTESAFFASIRQLASESGSAADVERVARDFLRHLETVTLSAFDRWCPMKGIASERISRLVRSRFTLVNAFRGKSKTGEKLFTALGLAVAQGAPAAAAKTKRSRKGASST